MEIHKLGKELIKLEIDVKYERIESYFWKREQILKIFVIPLWAIMLFMGQGPWWSFNPILKGPHSPKVTIKNFATLIQEGRSSCYR